MYAAAGGAALVVLVAAILAVKLLPRPSDGALFASPRAACSYTGAPFYVRRLDPDFWSEPQ